MPEMGAFDHFGVGFDNTRADSGQMRGTPLIAPPWSAHYRSSTELCRTSQEMTSSRKHDSRREHGAHGRAPPAKFGRIWTELGPGFRSEIRPGLTLHHSQVVFGVHPRSIRGRSNVDSGSTWGRLGVDVGSIGDRFGAELGIDLGSTSCQHFVDLGLIRGPCSANFWSSGGRLRIGLGSIRARSEVASGLRVVDCVLDCMSLGGAGSARSGTSLGQRSVASPTRGGCLNSPRAPRARRGASRGAPRVPRGSRAWRPGACRGAAPCSASARRRSGPSPSSRAAASPHSHSHTHHTHTHTLTESHPHSPHTHTPLPLRGL